MIFAMIYDISSCHKTSPVQIILYAESELSQITIGKCFGK